MMDLMDYLSMKKKKKDISDEDVLTERFGESETSLSSSSSHWSYQNNMRGFPTLQPQHTNNTIASI